ncbi:hypothetical protein MAPG_06961 [Magnaporthiopsis poae ATCC 64411]|uniref:Heterokaryon incompatibility domain-containing protein n=1 Tax=Magnaporthiopsis poae (strain ATCC 64411 / 73-15) TaxID=644358 RepID=A0A0C4E3G2_MAGP6|nr:hypothetical protein MAPG_06961 [Magnaporthiopsis poae ATCC 64411]
MRTKMALSSIYQPLDPARQEIRIIEITPFDPKDKSSVINCKLHVVSLLDKPDFIALSYTWGDPAVTKEIIVNGAPFNATVNLDAALRQAVRHSLGQVMREDLAASCRDDFPYDPEYPVPAWGAEAWWATQMDSYLAETDFTIPNWYPSSLRFWADAICINQADLAEKSSQIPLMGAVYSSAKLVVGSVGHGEDPRLDTGLRLLIDVCNAFASQKAELVRDMITERDGEHPEGKKFKFEVCREYVRESTRDPATQAAWRGYGYSASTATVKVWIENDWEWLKSPSYILSSLDHWAALVHLMESPYFSRVWTIQERHLAKSLVLVTDSLCFDWGKHRYDMLALGQWNPKTEPEEGETPESLRVRRVVSQFCRQHFPSLAVDALFTAQTVNTPWMVHSDTAMKKEATDKRDHVYGVLAVSKLPIPADYSKPVGEVFATMTIECLRKGSVDHLDRILALAGVGMTSYTPDMPSWTPHPGQRNIPTIDYGLLSEGQSATSGLFDEQDDEQKPVYSAQDLTITVRGVATVSVLRARVIPDDVGVYTGGMMSFLHDVLADGFLPDDGGVWSGRPMDALMANLFPAIAFDKQTHVVRDEDGNMVRICPPQMALAVQGWLDEPSFDGEPPDFRDKLRYQLLEGLGPSIIARIWPRERLEAVELDLRRQQTAVRGQSLFVTDGGYVGRGPRGLKPGDVVAFLEGSRMPVLLRDDDDGDGDSYRHVGTFYAYGLMDGEAPKLWIGEGYTEIGEIVIR